MIKDHPLTENAQPGPQDQATPLDYNSEQSWITGSYEELQQRILVLLEPARKGYRQLHKNEQLEAKVSAVEELLDIDLEDLLDSNTVSRLSGETDRFSPYSSERLEAKLTDLKSKYRSTPDLLQEEIENIARDAWRSLNSNYRRDQDRRQREEIRTKIQQITELIPAEKDALIGLVEENLSRYPALDSEMSIPVGQFNRKHIGLKDDNTVTKKFKALEQIGVLLDYQPGEIDKSNPERPFTMPARMRLNPEMVLFPSKIVKPSDLKAGGNRQSFCKNPQCVNSDPHNNADCLPPDPFKAEYCRTCQTTVISGLPGIASDANVDDMLISIREGRVLLSEQLHRFAENTKEQTVEAQKHYAFEEAEATPQTHIYVDDIATFETKLPYKQWCHMATDGPIEELHAMASQLLLKREWFQDKPGHPHYDLTPSKRRQAIALGAVAVTTQELIQVCHPHLTPKIDSQKHNAFEEAQARCSTCQIPVDQAEDHYYSEDGTPYCHQHGPQARPQVGQRVETPAGPAIIISITDCPILHRLRCSVQTDGQQEDNSYYRTFDLSEVSRTQPLNQGVLLQ